ncbi:MAG TPA: BTAD domain-containing putative transcriptional regulator, partial [Jiangellales bacterium]|nr:BTAD domain-containing putative transcriptional regulator [Jiangellales bacterium]
MTGPHVLVLGPAQLAGWPQDLGVKQRRLLAALAAHPGRPVAADRLVDVLWGKEATPASATTLQSHVSRLRRHLAESGAPTVVRTGPGGYQLEAADEELDTLLFERLLGQARALGDGDPGPRADVLGRALGLWRGAAYSDVAEHDVARGEAARLDELRVVAEEERCAALLAAGRWPDAVGELEALVRRQPLRESPRMLLVRALYRSGRQADALEVYQDFRRTLADELGLDPSPAFRELQAQVLGRSPLLDVPAPAPPREVPVASPGPAGDGPVDGDSGGGGDGRDRERERTEEGRPAGSSGDPPRATAERKLVTVLVAATAVPDSGDPDEAAEVLDPLLGVVGDAVHRFGGSVTAVGTDGVTAVFGVPVTTEDHAVRACRAAVEILDRSASALVGTPAVGLHSGEVIVGSLHSDLAGGGGPVGPAVERAREAARTAAAGTAVVSAETVHLTGGVVTAEPLPPRANGERGAVTWCRLVAVAPLTTWEARARLGLSVLTGREAQLAVLAAAVDRAAAGTGQVVALVGDPGVGKSRLVFETARAVPAGWTVLPCAASESGATQAFGAVRTTVRLALGLGASASGEEAAEALGRMPDGDVDAAGPDATALAALLEVGSRTEVAAWEALDPGVRRRRTISAVVDLLLSRAVEAPLLLVVEDAHWLDGESITVVEALADRAPSAALLVLVTYRPEFRPGWQHRQHVTVVPLEPLEGPEARSLAAALLGSAPGLANLGAQVADRAGGVPLFIEETVRALADDGRLSGEPGAYRLTGPIDDLGLPVRVQGIVAARIDRLPAEQRRLLQAASVVGAEAPVSVLRDVVREDPHEVETALAGLLGSQLLYERRRGTQRRYVFKHALVREAARASLPRPRRRELHGRVVDVLGAGAPAQQQDRLELLGHHAYEAGRWRLAVELLTLAGDRAQQRCAYREAAALLTRALEAQRRLPADAAAEIDLLVKLRPALHTISDFDGAQANLDRAEELALAAGDRRRLLLVELHRSYTMDTRGQVAGALEAGERALAIAQEVHDPLLASEARMALGQAHALAGDPAQALPLLRHDTALRLRLLREERLGMGFNRPVFATVLI